jgi:hypothetical protein
MAALDPRLRGDDKYLFFALTMHESASYVIRHNGETRTSTPSENVT